jgi:hypothetical protein
MSLTTEGRAFEGAFTLLRDEPQREHELHPEDAQDLHARQELVADVL